MCKELQYEKIDLKEAVGHAEDTISLLRNIRKNINKIFNKIFCMSRVINYST